MFSTTPPLWHTDAVGGRPPHQRCLMHKNLTHNQCYPTFAEFRAAVLIILREEVPRKWSTYCDEVTDNFCVISSKGFRVLA